MDDCVFCKIVRGELPSYKVWESDTHLAFLDINPAVEGMTLVVSKKHHSSYVADLDSEPVCQLMEAVQKVAKILDSRLDNVLRQKIVFEGVEVDHLHAKLLPIYKDEIEIMEVGDRASEDELKKVQERIVNGSSTEMK